MNSFAELDRFFNAFSPEVSGRSSDVLDPEMSARIKLFQSGNLAEEERRDLLQELLANPIALDHLASLLKD